MTTSPRYKGAVGQTTVEGFVGGLRQGGYMTDPNYVSKISAITTRYSSVIDESLRASGAAPISGNPSRQPVQTAASAPAATAANRPSAGVVVPDQLHIGLPVDEAMAACGPVAAIAFAQVYGRNPTVAETMALAKQSGWTSAGGMNGIANEKRLLDKMGLPAQLEMGANWDHIRAEAVQRQPVIVSTPGHYFVIDGYDANSGAYHVGQSGKVYRGGSEWMTPSQIAALAGAPSGALFAEHPLAPGSRQVLPPLEMPSGQPRQVLPPLPVAVTPQREVLPPLDLGNTPPPPPIPSPPVAAAPTEPGPSQSVPPPVAPEDVPPPPVEVPRTVAPLPIRDVPPPTLAHTDPSTLSRETVPHALRPGGARRRVEPVPDTSDAAPLAPPSDATIVQPVTPPADTAHPGLPVNPALAVGAVAVGSHKQEPPPPPPRRRRDDDEDDDLPRDG